jgi:hypothetical protein
MKRKRPAVAGLSMEQIDLAVSFYDVANDYPTESFIQIAKRVMPRGWTKATGAFKREARRMYGLAR